VNPTHLIVILAWIVGALVLIVGGLVALIVAGTARIGTAAAEDEAPAGPRLVRRRG
jgi:hypothetical protein